MVKKNGCRCPFHPYQIVSIFVVLFMPISYLVSVAPFLSAREITIYSVIFVGLYLGFVIPGIFLTLSDPTSPIRVIDLERSSQHRYEYFCSECKNYVFESTKHCGSCGRCVDNFDHHCKWLNNCIGGSNYKLFCGVIFMFELFLVYFASIQISLMLTSEEIFGEIPLLVVNIFMLLLNIIFGLCNAYLICFHVYLIVKGITTYQYIIMNRNSKIQPEEVEGQENDYEKSKFLQAGNSIVN